MPLGPGEGCPVLVCEIQWITYFTGGRATTNIRVTQYYTTRLPFAAGCLAPLALVNVIHSNSRGTHKLLIITGRVHFLVQDRCSFKLVHFDHSGVSIHAQCNVWGV